MALVSAITGYTRVYGQGGVSYAGGVLGEDLAELVPSGPTSSTAATALRQLLLFQNAAGERREPWPGQHGRWV